MLNFAMHGNSMPKDDLRFSADLPGEIATQTEQEIAKLNSDDNLEPILLFMNGAEGDVGEAGERTEEAMVKTGGDFAMQAAKSFARLQIVEPEIQARGRKIVLGYPAYPLMTCAKRDGWYKNWMKYLPGKITPIGLYPFFPMMVYLSMAQVGDIAFFSWPGEASTSVGWELKAMAKAEGWNNSWHLGLTNEYLIYFNSKEEYFESKYDSCSNMYHWRASKRIIKAHKKLLKSL